MARDIWVSGYQSGNLYRLVASNNYTVTTYNLKKAYVFTTTVDKDKNVICLTCDGSSKYYLTVLTAESNYTIITDYSIPASQTKNLATNKDGDVYFGSGASLCMASKSNSYSVTSFYQNITIASLVIAPNKDAWFTDGSYMKRLYHSLASNNYSNPTYLTTLSQFCYGTTFDKKGNIAVANEGGSTGSKISIFNAANNYLRTDLDFYGDPYNVKFDFNGDLWATGSGGKISRYSASNLWAKTDYQTSANGMISYGIGVDDDNSIWSIQGYDGGTTVSRFLASNNYSRTDYTVSVSNGGYNDFGDFIGTSLSIMGVLSPKPTAKPQSSYIGM